VVTCVTKAKGSRKAVTSATVRVDPDPRAGSTSTYRVELTFRDRAGTLVDHGAGTVEVDSAEDITGTLKVPMDTPSKVGQVVTCVVSAVERIA
jgi:hypothetical protein